MLMTELRSALYLRLTLEQTGAGAARMGRRSSAGRSWSRAEWSRCLPRRPERQREEGTDPDRADGSTAVVTSAFGATARVDRPQWQNLHTARRRRP